MKTYKVLLYISAILAIFENPNWAFFFWAGVILAFLSIIIGDDD